MIFQKKTMRDLFFAGGCLCLSAMSAHAEDALLVVRTCEAAILSKNSDVVIKMADEVKKMRNLFSSVVIKKGEACLEAATGEDWHYFPSKRVFLSGDVARAEENYISSSETRKADQKEKSDRLMCELLVAVNELKRLESLQEDVEEARSSETFISTYKACKVRYEMMPEETLLNAVCQDVFHIAGLPDSEFSFDYAALLTARKRVFTAEYNRVLSSESVSATEINKNLTDCESLLGKDQ